MRATLEWRDERLIHRPLRPKTKGPGVTTEPQI
jgi:hypothetical protein